MNVNSFFLNLKSMIKKIPKTRLTSIYTINLLIFKQNERLLQVLSESEWILFSIFEQRLFFNMLRSAQRAPEIWIGPWAPYNMQTASKVNWNWKRYIRNYEFCSFPIDLFTDYTKNLLICYDDAAIYKVNNNYRMDAWNNLINFPNWFNELGRNLVITICWKYSHCFKNE